MSDSHERILVLLKTAGISHQVHKHAEIRTIDEAAQRAPHLLENLVKTIAFEIEATKRIVLAAVPHTSQLDYKALSAVLVCNRRALRLLPPARVESELGFEVGGLGPFVLQPNVEVVMDSAVLAQTWLRCGAGLRTRTLELSVADVVGISQAQVAVISKSAS
jgi:Cys-tRNA(Pro)/Cys-tRNA(Cys) deacylase